MKNIFGLIATVACIFICAMIIETNDKSAVDKKSIFSSDYGPVIHNGVRCLKLIDGLFCEVKL